MNPFNRAGVLTATIGARVLLASCSTVPPSPPSRIPSSAAALAPAQGEQVTLSGTPQAPVTGLDAPWSVVFRDGTPLVSERDSGRILELADDGTARPIGTIEGVAAAGQGPA